MSGPARGGCTGQWDSSGLGDEVSGGTRGCAEGKNRIQLCATATLIDLAVARKVLLLLLQPKFGSAGGVQGWMRAVPEHGWL